VRSRPSLVLAAAAAVLTSGAALATAPGPSPDVPTALPASALGSAAVVPPVVPPVPGSTFQSANVEHLGTVPLEGVGVSMEVREVDGQQRAFVSGAAGLSIYDATDPTKPLLLGHLPFYNWENEDIAVSEDGKTALLTEFQGLLYLHVVDVSNPLVPRITGTLAPGGAHTVVCANPACTYAYGSEGQTYDLRDRTRPVRLTDRSKEWGRQLGAGTSGHNLHVDEAGVWVSDTDPLIVFEQVDGDPLTLRKLTDGKVTKDTAYQHNNIRPRADRYAPRAEDEGLDGPLRDGELLLGNGETNFTGTCGEDAGAFSTWSMAGFDQVGLRESDAGEPLGAEMVQLDVLRPLSSAATAGFPNGDPPVNSLGCSGHWFTETDAQDGSILVFAGWYEHGTRMIKVDPRTGKITQVGYFQPVRGSTSEAYLMPGSKDGTHVVWAVDFHSGIDILRFSEDAPAPSTTELDASWLLRGTDAFSVAARELCAAGAEATQQQHERMHGLVRGQVAARGPAALAVFDALPRTG
jgi:hypothetical protein